MAEGYGLLEINILPTGEIYLLLSKNLREDPAHTKLQFVKLSSNCEVVWSTNFEFSVAQLSIQPYFRHSQKSNGPIFASISDPSNDAIYYSLGNTVHKLTESTGDYEWLHVFDTETGILGITATTKGVIAQITNTVEDALAFKLVCLSPQNTILWTSTELQMNVFAFQDAGIMSINGVIVTYQVVFGSYEGKSGYITHFMVRDEKGSKIEEQMFYTTSGADHVIPFLVNEGSYIILKVTELNTKFSMSWYNFEYHKAAIESAIIISSLLTVAIAMRRKKK